MTHSALRAGAVAVVTGGAAGIGLAAAERFARLGLTVCIADLGTARLALAAERLARAAPEGSARIHAVECDVRLREDVARLEAEMRDRFGGTDVLMNNAGIQPGSTLFGPAETWERILATNLWGIINGTQIFVPRMVSRGRPGLVINTGSKQGITTPPGDPAYNVAKAGVKAFTEALAHELRSTEGAAITAHLLIPGFVFTGLTANGRTEKPDAAWSPEETADLMLQGRDAGDLYILCPDIGVARALDEKRIL